METSMSSIHQNGIPAAVLHRMGATSPSQNGTASAATSPEDGRSPKADGPQASSSSTINIDFESGHQSGDDDTPKKTGRRKINIEFIEDKSRRHITFSKRKAGIMKKAYELSTLTGTQVLLLVASETGHVYTFATPKLQPLITKTEGKNLIQACLNAPDPSPAPSLPDGKAMSMPSWMRAPGQEAHSQTFTGEHSLALPAPMQHQHQIQQHQEEEDKEHTARKAELASQASMYPGAYAMPTMSPYAAMAIRNGYSTPGMTAQAAQAQAQAQAQAAHAQAHAQGLAQAQAQAVQAQVQAQAQAYAAVAAAAAGQSVPFSAQNMYSNQGYPYGAGTMWSMGPNGTPQLASSSQASSHPGKSGHDDN